MVTTICLIRHGVTDWNCEGRNQGHTDIPLNSEGRRQATAMAPLVAAEHWDAIYASPLCRAYETAKAVADLTGHSISTDPRLMEREMGVVEGTTHAERCARWPGVHWKEIPGVEQDEALVDRAMSALREIAGRHPGQRVICVAHGGLISAFLHAIAVPGGHTPRIHQRNTSFVHVTFDGTRFLQQGPSTYSHLVVDGVEYSAEKGRVAGGGMAHLAKLLPEPLPADDLEAIVAHATAVEAAWIEDQLVGFARCFTDGVYAGFIDLAVADEGYAHVLPQLKQRLADRYPRVAFA